MITGAPGTGKTTIINQLKSLGYSCSNEISREIIAEQIATNYRKADISDRQLAMLDFAVKVSQDASVISKEDIQALASYGFSEQDVWDIGAIAAFFALSNRLANMANIRPNDEFYHMGRIEIG